MRCPIDSTELVIVERQGINTHACPVCKGVWLERDDLDEIINRSIPGGIPTVAGAEMSRGVGNGLDEEVDDRGRDSDRSRRRRDKYSDDFVEFERPRKGKKKRGGRQDEYEDMLDF